MNANELADELDIYGESVKSGVSPFTKHADMLRKQHAEIIQLKNLLLDNQILLDKTLNAWAKEMERKK